MKKFMVLYTAPQSAEQNMGGDPEEMKGVMNAWQKWMENCGSGMVDMGTPLGNGMKVTSSGVEKSNSQTVGYTVLQAESIEDAVNMLKDHPHLNMPGACAIEVFESMPVPM